MNNKFDGMVRQTACQLTSRSKILKNLQALTAQALLFRGKDASVWGWCLTWTGEINLCVCGRN